MGVHHLVIDQFQSVLNCVMVRLRVEDLKQFTVPETVIDKVQVEKAKLQQLVKEAVSW